MRTRLTTGALAAVVSVALVSIALAFPAGAATKPKTLDRDAIRRTVEQLVHTSYPSVAFGNIACPSGLPLKRDVRLTCTVQLPGAFVVLSGRQADAAGTVEFTGDQVILERDALQKFVAANASVDASVDCGGAPWRTSRIGATIACTAKLADGATRQVTLSVRDREGTVAIASVS